MKKAHSVAGTWSIQKNESRNVRPIWGVINAENVPSISSGNNFTRIKKKGRERNNTHAHTTLYTKYLTCSLLASYLLGNK